MNLASSLERTVLHPTASIANLENAIGEAKKYPLAGLSVPPFWVKKVKRDLDNLPISLATVVGFPFGYQRTETKLAEMKIALQDGATDLEVTLNTSALLSPTASWIKIELAKCAILAHTHQALLTVIIEGSLLDDDQIRTCCKISADAGVDFVKNATGFVTGHLLISSLVEQITLFRQSLPLSVGIKAVGDIRSGEAAKRLLAAGASRVCIANSVDSVLI
ncbi:MAG: deoxyribose-phosphate aldolase [Bacteroidota bacterium]